MSALVAILTTPITYVEIAMLIFIAVFITVLVRETVRSKPDAIRMAGMPLESESADPALQEEARE